MASAWIEITCELPSDLEDVFAGYASSLSGAGVCTENLKVDAFSLNEIEFPPVKIIKLYFNGDDDADTRLMEVQSFLDLLMSRHPGLYLPKPAVSMVSDEDWSASWKTNFKPIRVGRRLVILPTWEEAPPKRDDDVTLLIDPGMAFGTGGHETTRLCLEVLENIMDNMPFMLTPSLLDLGTGSGILAIAAVKLGAGRVCALDTDPQAVEVARENFVLNDVADQIECGVTPIESFAGTFDVILANILAEELARLAPSLIDHLKTGGFLVLSGILAEKESLVFKAFLSNNLEYIETRSDGEWVAMLYKKVKAP